MVYSVSCTSNSNVSFQNVNNGFEISEKITTNLNFFAPQSKKITHVLSTGQSRTIKVADWKTSKLRAI